MSIFNEPVQKIARAFPYHDSLNKILRNITAENDFIPAKQETSKKTPVNENKPAGSLYASASFSFARYVTSFRSLHSILTRPPSRQNVTTILNARIAHNYILLYFI